MEADEVHEDDDEAEEPPEECEDTGGDGLDVGKKERRKIKEIILKKIMPFLSEAF